MILVVWQTEIGRAKTRWCLSVWIHWEDYKKHRYQKNRETTPWFHQIFWPSMTSPVSTEVATLEAKAKPAKESKAPAAPAPVSCPMGPVAPMAPVAPRSERELLKQMLRRNEVFKIRFLMRRDGFHHYDLKNLRSEL